MIVEFMAMNGWWLLPLVGISFGAQDSSGQQSSQSTSRSRGESMAEGFSRSMGQSGSSTASQTGIGSRLRPQLENIVGGLTERFNTSPLISSLMNMGTPQIPTLNASGLFPAQEALLPELVRLATSPISAGMASRGMVSPENTAEVGGGVAKALAPTLLPIISKNLTDMAVLPGQAIASSVSPFTNLIGTLTNLLGGTSTGVSSATQESFAQQLARALQQSESQATSSGSQDASGFSFGFNPKTSGGGAPGMG